MASRHVFVFLVLAVLPGVAAGCVAEDRTGSGSPGTPESSANSARSGTGYGNSLDESSPGANDFGEALPEIDDTLFRRVDRRARSLAAAPYVASNEDLPAPLRDIGYDEYRSIRYRPEQALWRGEGPFELQLFHPGYGSESRVAIHVLEARETRTVEFDAGRFRYEGAAASLADLGESTAGHAGFRVHYPMNDAASKDEVVVFLGASYFRLLGPGQVHGLSSRGIAVDAGLASGEEFPRFREFWLVKPGPDAEALTFYALLDGPSITGAYRFELNPGEPGNSGSEVDPATVPDPGSPAESEPGNGDTVMSPSENSKGGGRAPEVGEWRLPDGDLPTVMDVEARLYARNDVEKLGVAPLTSMFLFDPNNARHFDDFRARVHDSQGLLALNGSGEWIWRPLHNGPGLRVTQLRDRDPRGFGLVQRQRDFDAYLDLEARYDQRPSEWVEVVDGHWGSGGVELLEIPTESEFNDNIVAYWVSDAPFRAGDARYYRYRLVTFDERLPHQSLAQVDRTRIGWDALPGEADPPPRSRRRFVVDFVRGEAIASGTTDTPTPPVDSVEVSLATSTGTIEASRTELLPREKGWRVTFDLEPAGDRPSDMRLYLEAGGRRLTETWSYVWYPEQAE